MTEADVIQPSASIASTGPGIRYIGNYAYAYSGSVSVDSSGADLLDFTTGAGFINSQLQISTTGGEGTNFDMILKLNDIDIISEEFGNTYQLYPSASSPWLLIIPPFTSFKLNLKSQGSAKAWLATFTGRVYGAD